MSASHVTYGLRISASLPLPGLPAQPDQPQPEAPDVRIQLKETPRLFPMLFDPPTDFSYIAPNFDADGNPNLRVGMLAGGKYYGFFYGDGTRFAVEREGNEIWADWPENYSLEDACTYLMGPVIGFVLRLRGATCLHASSIAVHNRAIALMGAAGAGKSTTAAAFALRGFSVVSDDVVALSDLGDQFLVRPGYPRLNLWPDAVRELFGSEDALPNISPTWEKRYLDLNGNCRRFQGEPLPLGAIYILCDRKPGLAAPAIEELVGSEALTTLVANSYVHYLLDGDMQRRDFEVLSRVVARVPVRRVRPVADPSKLSGLCESISADAGKILV